MNNLSSPSLENPICLIKDKALLKWVGDFIEKHVLAGDSKRVVCGLSGGPDSMLLAHVCQGLKKEGLLKSVRHVHVDHGLREESGMEAFELKQMVEEWGWDFRLLKVTGKPPKNNVESWARKVRRHLLLSECGEDEVLFLAHHIDDSFEWFIRQTLGSSQGPIRQGIPLINGLVRRPFHCLSRAQIIRFVKNFDIPVIEDASNEDLRFQRNQIRHRVKNPLLEMFPKGMAHFVERSNEWARKENLSSENNKQGRKPKIDVVEVTEDIVCLVMKEQGRWEEVKPLILKYLQRLSSKNRGQLRQNLGKLFDTLIEGRNRGPLHFSGGVEVAIYPGTLLILNQRGRKKLNKINNNFASQIPGVSLKILHSQIGAKKLPFVLFQNKVFGLKGLKNDPFFQNTIKYGQDLGLNLRPLSHLEMAAKKQGRLDQKFKGILLSL